MNFSNRAQEIKDEICKNRRHIHKHPELSMVEYETTKFLTQELEKLGIEVQTFDDYTGCIGIIKGKNKGSTYKRRS